MTFARKLLFDHTKPVVCHCVSRCVRRLFLTQDEKWRRGLMDRMRVLTMHVAIDVLEAAVLGNHLHVVAATHPDLAALWDGREVARRYRSLCPDHAWRIRRKIAIDLPAQPEEIEKAVADPLLIAKWREELSSLSFFHKLLKQKIARAINLAADATGHCWEGRFKSIVALDDDAVIAHMVYVALNPVRASIADALDEYEFATVAERVEDLKRRIANGEFAGEAAAARERLRDAQLLPAMPCHPGPAVSAMPVLPGGVENPWLNGRIPPVIEGSSLAAFLHDIDAEGREPAFGKSGCIPESTPRVLAQLDAELAVFAVEQTAASPLMRAARSITAKLDRAMSRARNGAWGNFSGSARSLAEHARATGRKFAVGIFGDAEDDSGRRVKAAAANRDGQAAATAQTPRLLAT